MSVEDNKALVRRFFGDALDQGNTGLLSDMFNDNCEFYRVDFDEPVRGLGGIKAVVEKRAHLYRDFVTKIHSLIGEDDMVASPTKPYRRSPGRFSHADRDVQCAGSANRVVFTGVLSV